MSALSSMPKGLVCMNFAIWTYVLILFCDQADRYNYTGRCICSVYTPLCHTQIGLETDVKTRFVEICCQAELRWNCALSEREAADNPGK